MNNWHEKEEETVDRCMASELALRTVRAPWSVLLEQCLSKRQGKYYGLLGAFLHIKGIGVENRKKENSNFFSPLQ